MKDQKEIGADIEGQIATLLRFYGYQVSQAPYGSGADLIAEKGASGVFYLEVKSMRDWVFNPSQSNIYQKTRGRPVIRAESHRLLLEQPKPFYVFCQYALRRDGMHIKEEVSDSPVLEELRVSHADFIQIGAQPRICLSLKLIMSLPYLLPHGLLTYRRESYELELYSGREAQESETSDS